MARRVPEFDGFAAVVGLGDEPGAPHHLELVGLVPVVSVLVSLSGDPALRAASCRVREMLRPMILAASRVLTWPSGGG
jgi:hypothetical protein